MNATFSWFEALILVGIIQGLIISCLIWFRKKGNRSNVLLSLVLSVFSLLCIRILILTTGLWSNPILRYFPLPFELAIAPLFYLYILSLVNSRFTFKKSYFIHFIPFAISLVYSAVIYCLVLPKGSNTEKDVFANSLLFNEVKNVEDYLGIISAVIYWMLGLRFVIRYRNWLSNNVSNTDYPTYSWLKNIALLMGLLIVLLSIDILLDSLFNFGFHRFTHWKFFFVYFAALIYYLGFRGYQLPDRPSHVVSTTPDEAIEQPLTEEQTLFTAVEHDHVELPEKILKISDERATEIERAIRKALDVDALYLDPELNLNKLAKFTNNPSTAVSYTINLKFKKTFRTLINEYRVETVKARLGNPKYSQFSILGIAYECGFNSEASFYRIFKSIAGVSPKEYLKGINQDRL